MQTSDDGEYIPEKELNRTFKIPKRKVEEVTEDSETICQQNDQPAPVLENSYYNYHPPMGLLGPWQQPGAAFFAPYQPNTSYNVAEESEAEPITQKIYHALSDYKEKPKNYKKDIFKETVPDCDDSSLPKELISLFQPLYCKLCSAQLSSNVMAKLHYKSRNHEKKIKKFLIEYSERTGEPLHKRAKLLPIKKTDEEVNNPKYFHCDVCDLPLTGKLHAESHYMGKNHQKALLGYKAPAGKGFYNDDGKWIRSQLTKRTLSSGDDGFGADFRVKPVAETSDGSNDLAPVSLSNVPSSSSATQSKFQCDICFVSATCLQQLEMHYKGQKHQKKLKQLGLPATSGASALVVANHSQGTTNDTVLSSVLTSSSKVEKNNLSAYRTPSGQYYCQICNLTLNSEAQFKIHLQSKNHHKKSTLQQK